MNMMKASEQPIVSDNEIYTQEGVEQKSEQKPSTDIATIARRISKTWKNPYFGAKPYLSAMTQLHSIEDNYGCDSARSIVRYFLANASSFRGDEAREIKAQLKEMLK